MFSDEPFLVCKVLGSEGLGDAGLGQAATTVRRRLPGARGVCVSVRVSVCARVSVRECARE